MGPWSLRRVSPEVPNLASMRFVGSPHVAGQADKAPTVTAQSTLAAARGTATTCSEDEITLCLREGRFRVRIDWRDFKGAVGVAHAKGLNETTGYFWFFDESNIEIVLKILDCSGFQWPFLGVLRCRIECRVHDPGRRYRDWRLEELLQRERALRQQGRYACLFQCSSLRGQRDGMFLDPTIHKSLLQDHAPNRAG